jgi:hypothetical protein
MKHLAGAERAAPAAGFHGHAARPPHHHLPPHPAVTAPGDYYSRHTGQHDHPSGNLKVEE